MFTSYKALEVIKQTVSTTVENMAHELRTSKLAMSLVQLEAMIGSIIDQTEDIDANIKIGELELEVAGMVNLKHAYERSSKELSSLLAKISQLEETLNKEIAEKNALGSLLSDLRDEHEALKKECL
jgi:hypothetical protein